MRSWEELKAAKQALIEQLSVIETSEAKKLLDICQSLGEFPSEKELRDHVSKSNLSIGKVSGIFSSSNAQIKEIYNQLQALNAEANDPSLVNERPRRTPSP